jgi:hypothetical protein
MYQFDALGELLERQDVGGPGKFRRGGLKLGFITE